MNFKRIYEASNLDNPLERDAKRKKEFEDKISNILGEDWKFSDGIIDFESDSMYDEVLNLVDEYSDIADIEHNDYGDDAEEYWYIYDKDSDDTINYRKEQFNNTLFDKWGVKDGDKVSEVHVNGSYDGERIYYNPTIKIKDYGYELELLNPTEIRNGNGRKLRPRNWGYEYSLNYIVDIKK